MSDLVPVPDVVGKTQEDAEAQLKAAGLTVTSTGVPSDAVATGSVVSSEPAAGAPVAAGSEVKLNVSSVPAKVAVPNVVGMARREAEAKLKAAGLTVGTPTGVPSDKAVGSVVSSDPAAGTPVASGSVNLHLSSGLAKVAVPNVVGMA
jgi:beta-lactam-binding protein with PASTA domain